MGSITRFSGYAVNTGEFTSNELLEKIKGYSSQNGLELCQVKSEESESFYVDGELDKNCDMGLLASHFNPVEDYYKFDRPLPSKGDKYTHFKTGKVVEVICISRSTETNEVSVVYKHDGVVYNRPIEMFMSEVDRSKYPNAKQRYRLELLV